MQPPEDRPVAESQHLGELAPAQQLVARNARLVNALGPRRAPEPRSASAQSRTAHLVLSGEAGHRMVDFLNLFYPGYDEPQH